MLVMISAIPAARNSIGDFLPLVFFLTRCVARRLPGKLMDKKAYQLDNFLLEKKW